MPNLLAKDDDEIKYIWGNINDVLLLKIFFNLSFKDLVNANRTCQSWNRVGKDEFIWKNLCYSYFKINKTLSKPPETTWIQEFKRLYYHAPIVETENVCCHTDQVLHVSFSHNGKMFSTSSKDGFVRVWNPNNFPVSLLHSKDMREFKWKYTQFTQFNCNDSLLLVSGVHFGPHTTTGEIAVFSLENNQFELQCRIQNKPYDIFGTWYNEQYLLSGSLEWYGNLTSCSKLWLNKASQAIESEKESVTKNVYKFYNKNASSIRTIMIVDCPDDSKISDLSRKRKDPFNNVEKNNATGKSRRDEVGAKKIIECDNMFVEEDETDFENTMEHVVNDSGNLSSEKEKYLIFTTGEKTYTPHQIGIKRIPVSILQNGKLGNVPNAMDHFHELSQEDHFQQIIYDDVDHLVELHGHIIGMCLSPDERYLYVNSRPWPKDYIITDPLYPPPIAQEIDIHVIDLFSFKQVGTMHRAHKAYTPNDECFFIFLDVSKHYVSSGAEDKNGYLWDRHYGVCLQKFEHCDVVNSVSFNPKDSEYLVTVSDDKTFKIWRSRCRAKEILKGKKYPIVTNVETNT